MDGRPSECPIWVNLLSSQWPREGPFSAQSSLIAGVRSATALRAKAVIQTRFAAAPRDTPDYRVESPGYFGPGPFDGNPRQAFLARATSSN
jgi:hypothetical protein